MFQIVRKILRKLKSWLQVKHFENAPTEVALLSTFRSEHSGSTDRKSSKLCLFASWDPHGFIDPYVRNYLSRIRDEGYDIQFVTTAPQIDQGDLTLAQSICSKVIHRRNFGLDFASWKLAINRMSSAEIRSYDQILLANDSCFGPFQDLGPILKSLEQSPAPLCGLCDNWEKFYHLQSFFVLLKREFIESPVWDEFWNGVRVLIDKNQIIENYEVGLTNLAIKQRFATKSYIDYFAVRKHCLDLGTKFQYHDLVWGQPVNMTVYMWDILLSKFNSPFLKTEVLKANPKGSHVICSWQDLVPSHERGQIDLILNYLKRTVPNCRA